VEWLAVITWLVIAAIGVVLGRWALSTPGAGLAASSAGRPAEELQAALTGLQLPLLAAVACMSLLVALKLVTATI
jgi:hypothetical protein